MKELFTEIQTFPFHPFLIHLELIHCFMAFFFAALLLLFQHFKNDSKLYFCSALSLTGLGVLNFFQSLSPYQDQLSVHYHTLSSLFGGLGFASIHLKEKNEGFPLNLFHLFLYFLFCLAVSIVSYFLRKDFPPLISLQALAGLFYLSAAISIAFFQKKIPLLHRIYFSVYCVLQIISAISFLTLIWNFLAILYLGAGILYTVHLLLQLKKDITNHLSLIYNSASDFMALVQVEPQDVFRLTSFNKAWFMASGLPPETILGKPLSEILTADEYEGVKLHYLQAIDTQKPVSWEDSYENPQGQITIETQATPIFNSENKCTHILAVSRDRTSKYKEIKRQNFLATVSGQLFRSLNMPSTLKTLCQSIVPELASCCSIDILGGDQQLHCLEMAHYEFDDGKMEQIKSIRKEHPFDLSAKTGVPHVLWTGQSEVHSSPTPERLQEIFPNQGYLMILKQMPISSVMLVPLQARGQTFGVVSFVRSHQSRPYTSDDLQLAAELCYRAALAIDNARLYGEAQEAVRLREEFMTIASHELRTPLTPLKIQMQLLLKMLQGQDFQPLPQISKLLKMVEISDRQVNRFGKLVEDLLDISRIRAGQLILNLEPCDLSLIVQEVAERFQLEVEKKKCQLELSLQGPLIGNWDQLRLEQVVINLLANALKYGANGPIKLTSTKTVKGAMLIVQDFGIGIAKKDHLRIFGPYERAVPVKSYGGLGIGLNITQQIIKAHGGQIRVEGMLGQGATFIVELPLGQILKET